MPVQDLFIEEVQAECLMQIALKFPNLVAALEEENDDDVPGSEQNVIGDVYAVYINRFTKELAISFGDTENRVTYCPYSTTFTHLIEAVYAEIRKFYDDMRLHLEFFVENVISDRALQGSIWDYKVEQMPILQGFVTVML